MAHFHALGVAARAYPDESNSIAVLGVHIGLNLKHKTRKRRLKCVDFATLSGSGQRLWRPLNKVIQHLAYAKVTQCCAEKYRREPSGEKLIMIKLMTGAAH